MDGGSLGRPAAAALCPENGKEGPEKIEGWGCSAELPSARQRSLRAATPGRSAAPRQLCLLFLLSLKESQGAFREGVSHPLQWVDCGQEAGLRSRMKRVPVAGGEKGSLTAGLVGNGGRGPPCPLSTCYSPSACVVVEHTRSEFHHCKIRRAKVRTPNEKQSGAGWRGGTDGGLGASSFPSATAWVSPASRPNPEAPAWPGLPLWGAPRDRPRLALLPFSREATPAWPDPLWAQVA